jgi:hypothetical protein
MNPAYIELICDCGLKYLTPVDQPESMCSNCQADPKCRPAPYWKNSYQQRKKFKRQRQEETARGKALEAKRRYNERHPERVKEQQDRYQAANRDELNAAHREWYYANRDERKAKSLSWYATHRDEYNAARRVKR